MKRSASLLCLLLILALLCGMFAGCGTDAASSAASSAASTEATASAAAPSETPEAPSAPAEADSAEEASAAESSTLDGNASGQQSEDGIASLTTEGAPQGAISFPLEETVSFTYWFAPEADGMEQLDSFNDNLALKTAEEMTNVHLELQEVSFMAQEEQFNLMVASNDYPDIIQRFGALYSRGIDNAIDEDILVDLTDLLPDYAPNYSYLRDNNAELKKSTTTDTGRVGSFFFLIGDADLGPRQGLWIRQDWLDAQGLEVPATYDELHETLLTMKNAYGCSDPLLLTSTGYFSSMTLLGGYDVGASFYNQDGTIKYGPIEEGFHEYVEMLHQWYTEGLISSDFATRDEMSLMFDATPIINDSTAVWNANYRGDDSWKNSAADPNFTPLAIPDVTKTGTEQIHVGGKGSNVDSYGCAVSTGCEDPETAVAWIDWWYSDEATMLSSYGVEGETFYYNEDGQPLYTDVVLNNDLGSARAMRNIYTGMSLAFRVFRVVTAGYDNGYDILDRGTWASNRDNAWDISNFISRTTEEGEEYNAVMSEVETYVEENIPKFIIGDRDLSEWDTYVQDIKDMGIDVAIEIETACVERYNER